MVSQGPLGTGAWRVRQTQAESSWRRVLVAEKGREWNWGLVGIEEGGLNPHPPAGDVDEPPA